MRLKLKPYPCVLKLILSDDLPENTYGDVCSIGSLIVMRLRRDSWIHCYIHESMHVIQAIEEYIQTKFDKETEAYWIQYISLWIIDNISRGNKTNDRRKYRSKRNKRIEGA